MKVGTDGVLVGAWAPVDGVRRILDIGAGSGLITMMMAQRAPQAMVTGVEIDAVAAREAAANIASLPWPDRAVIVAADIVAEGDKLGEFDLIVSNPPFFASGEAAPQQRRGLARHECGLTYEWLLSFASRSLAPNGRIAFIAPADRGDDIDYYAAMAALYPQRVTDVVTVPGKAPKRQLWLLSRAYQPVVLDTLYIRDASGEYTREFRELCRDFYLAF